MRQIWRFQMLTRKLWQPILARFCGYPAWTMLINAKRFDAHDMPMTGWWFGSFFIFPSIVNSNPNWLYNIFRRGSNHQPDDICLRYADMPNDGLDQKNRLHLPWCFFLLQRLMLRLLRIAMSSDFIRFHSHQVGHPAVAHPVILVIHTESKYIYIYVHIIWYIYIYIYIYIYTYIYI